MNEIFSIKHELSGSTAARKNPEKYPGWWPAKSFIVDARSPSSASELFYLNAPKLGFQSEENSESLSGMPSFRAGHLEVVSFNDHSYHGSLNQFLRDRGLAPMEQRFPVLAVGSNASPSQLAYKFMKTGISGAIPTIRVSVADYGVGFVPAVSTFGYVPATLVREPGLKSNLFLQFLDANQLVVMDQSEGVSPKVMKDGSDSPTSYEREGISMKLELAHNETLGFAYAYVARRGFISFEGKPVLCDNSQFGLEAQQDDLESETPKKDRRFWVNELREGYRRCSNQSELIELIRSEDEDLANQLLVALTAKPQSEESVEARNEINSSILAFRAKNEPQAQEPSLDVTYSKLDQTGLRPKLSDVKPDEETTEVQGAAKKDKYNPVWEGESLVAVALPTDHVERKGESIVMLHPEDFELLGKPLYLGIRSLPIVSVLGQQSKSQKNAPEPIGRVIKADKVDLVRTGILQGQILIDEVLRVASGIHVGEKMLVRKLEDPMKWLRRAWFKIMTFMLGRPNYVTGRATFSDVTTMERDVALVTPLTMQMLGIESGDSAVIESTHREVVETVEKDVAGSVHKDKTKSEIKMKIKTVSIRIFPLDEATLENRGEAQRGGWLSIIPDAKLCLGIHADLAPIFIDAALREYLFGKNHGQSVGVIRLRASFPEKISGEIRELIAVIVLAVLAWILTIPESVLPFSARIIMIGAIFIFAIILILLRIRIRYRHTKRSRK